MNKSRHIYICEDDELLRETVRDILTDAGYSVTACEDASQLIKKLNSLLPNVIVSDINMPNMTGIEMIKLLNKKQINIPVVFLTGQKDIETFRETFSEGHFDFLRKPINAPELLLAVQKALTFKVDKPDTFVVKKIKSKTA